jgi:hypothetical protein
MRKTKVISLILAIVLILSQTAVFAAEESYTLEIGGALVETELKFTMDELKALPEEAQINQEYLYNSKSGENLVEVKGVSLAYLLKEKAGVTAEEGKVEFFASDGYPIDPQTLQDILNEELNFVLAYEVDGEELSEVTIYRNLKYEGEYNTVYKYICKIALSEAEAAETPEEPVTEPEKDQDVEIVFTDITDEYKFAEEAIYDLASRKILDGIGGGLFAPGNEFTREQFCKIIVVALGYDLKDYEGAFSDIAEDRWSAPYVQAAVDSGLFIGNPDGTFAPEKVISRQEMAVVAARAAVAKGIVEIERLNKFVMEKSDYLDKDAVADWAANAVAWLEAQKVFEGIAGENFEPAKSVNRAEAAVVVYKTLFAE